MKTRIHAQKGFTLLELMMSLAVISILASIAIPRFHRFSARAKQSEAKSNLSALFTAESVFYGEWNGYTGDLRDLGVVISGNLQYDIGFAAPGWAPVSPNFVPVSNVMCSARTAFNTEVSPCAISAGSTQAKAAFAAAIPGNGCGGGVVPTSTSFRATAVGLIAGATPDIWTIDEAKILCNNQPRLE